MKCLVRLRCLKSSLLWACLKELNFKGTGHIYDSVNRWLEFLSGWLFCSRGLLLYIRSYTNRFPVIGCLYFCKITLRFAWNTCNVVVISVSSEKWWSSGNISVTIFCLQMPQFVCFLIEGMKWPFNSKIEEVVHHFILNDRAGLCLSLPQSFQSTEQQVEGGFSLWSAVWTLYHSPHAC